MRLLDPTMLMRWIGGAATAMMMLAGARAEPVTLGPGDDPPARVEITAQRVDVTTHGVSKSSATLRRTFVGAIDHATSGVRHMSVRLTQIGGAATDDNEIVRLSGDVELYLLQSLKDIELILAFDRDGVATSIDNWDEARAKIVDAVARRVAELATGHPAIHPATALAAEVVEQMHQQVAKGFVERITAMSAADFLQAFFPEPGLVLIASNARLEVGDAVRRAAVLRGPSGAPFAMTELYRLRELDAGRTRAVLDILPDDSLDAMLRERMAEEFRSHKLDEEDIRRRVEAMAIRSERGGTAEVDVASGRTRHMRLAYLMHVGAYDYKADEEVTFAPLP
jgi:hypothetical protein